MDEDFIEISVPNQPDRKFHTFLTSVVAPRPIALVSTIGKDGCVNLAPFSFFNAFSSCPPVVIFSPSRRVRDNTEKDTLKNLKEVHECVVNAVSYDIWHNVSFSSTEYPYGINEFIKSGLTPIPSKIVKPPRVKESPVSMECRVKQIIPLGNKGGAGNLVICEIILIHANKKIFNSDGTVNPNKIRLMGRLGQSWYAKAWSDALEWLPQPENNLGIGYDAIPHYILNSSILTAKDIYLLASFKELPSKSEVENYIRDNNYSKPANLPTLHCNIKKYLEKGEIKKAWLEIMAYKIE